MHKTRMRYKGVQLPSALIERIVKLIGERPELGYVSVKGFVEDSIRRRVEKVEKLTED
ncbi:MAG: hypothetical protein ACUVQ8_01130 [Nitrososphaeria archaeon]